MRIRSIWQAISLVALAAPGTAAAQLAQVGQLEVTLSPTRVNPSNCDATVRITVEATTNGAPVTGLEGSDRWTVAVGSGTNCDDAEEIDVGDFTTVPGTPGSYRTTVRASELVEPVTGASCESITGTQRVNVCVIWDNTTGDDADDRVQFTVTTERPDAPVLTRAEPGDGRLRLHFQPANDSPDSWDVCYRAVGSSTAALVGPFGIGGAGGVDGAGGTGGLDGTGGTGGSGGEVGAGGTGGSGGIGEGTGGTGGTGGGDGTGGSGGSVPDLCEEGRVRRDISGSRRSYTLEGLRNGTTYQVAVRAVDDAGNVSATSNVLEATPQRVFDFWETYKNAGGAEDGGCSSAAGPAALGLLLSGLFVFRRRNGRR